jgi:hypothetical protein
VTEAIASSRYSSDEMAIHLRAWPSDLWSLSGARARSPSARRAATWCADPATFVVVPLFLGLVALAASRVPALRASRVSPSSALRDDG